MPHVAEFLFSPSEDLGDLKDEFVARGCRVRLCGAVLRVEALGDDADPTAVARAYGDSLRERLHLLHVQLLTLEEFARLPGRAISSRALSSQERERRRRELRETRRTMVAESDARLSQCYDYFQTAIDDPEHALSQLYKMVETIEGKYGSEREAVRALGMPELKDLKRLANDHGPDSRDQRHAPAAPGTGRPMSEAEVARALDGGQRLLRRFEILNLEQM